MGTLSSFWKLGEEKHFLSPVSIHKVRGLTMDTDRRLPEILIAIHARLRKAGGGNRKVYYIQTLKSYALCTYT